LITIYMKPIYIGMYNAASFKNQTVYNGANEVAITMLHTYQARVSVDKIVPALPSDNSCQLHTIGMSSLSIHGHIQVYQWDGLSGCGILGEDTIICAVYILNIYIYTCIQQAVASRITFITPLNAG